jgi:Asp-tRNA(Asn)/Glu-tRNA(Gln) amidotransferase A subunit family amidase
VSARPGEGGGAARPLHALGAAEALALLRGGALTAEALVRALLERIAAEEPRVEAWEFLDPELALAQARRVDAAAPKPPLAGLPVAVKDVIDTADMPTACGSPIHRGRRPAADAACVAALRARGAVILGKTVTTEFAAYAPGKTRNPHDPGRTPGGSSSGSAAAVAAGMVPAALGTQTAGSIIRPASFCGVVGFKPSYGRLPLGGVSPLAGSLDTLGMFTRSVADLPPLARALGLEVPEALPPGPPPRVGLCRTEQWPLAEPGTRRLVEDAAGRLRAAGAAVVEVELGPELAGLADAQRVIMAVEVARAFARERREDADRLSPALRQLIDEGAGTAPQRYRAALELGERGRRLAPRAFAGADVLLTPSAAGEAPPGLAGTGDPAFNRIWTLLHLPCLNLPGLRGPHGLPVGVQLVGPAGGDAALLAAAAWAEPLLGG